MTINNTTAINTDSSWDAYLESLDSLCGIESDLTSLEQSYLKAEAIRDSYRRWLSKKIDESDTNADTSFLEEELESLQTADDSGLNRWGTRPEMGEVEYGEVMEESALEVWADTYEMGFFRSEELAESGPQLTWINEKTFVKREDAQRFVDETRKSFAKGNHDAEVIKTRIDKGKEEPFVAVVLEADKNWGHKLALAAERDRHLRNALRQIDNADTASRLNNLRRIVKRYSRDMQVLNQGKTRDGKRVVGVGFDYRRYATAMNALAAQAEELGFTGYKTMALKDFPETEKNLDGDLLDRGAQVGEFLLDSVMEETTISLWEMKERTYRPSPEGKARLEAMGPVGFVYRSWAEIVSDFDSGWSMTSCGSLAA